MGKECRTCVFNTKNESCKMLTERIKNCWAWADEEEYQRREDEIKAHRIDISGLEVKRGTPREKLDEHFKELYEQGLPDRQIAAELNIHETSVGDYRKKLGLESNFLKNTTTQVLDKEFLQYYEDGLNDNQIATKLGFHPTTIRNYRVKLGLETQNERKKSLREQAN